MLLIVIVCVIMNIVVINDYWKRTVKDNNRYQKGQWTTKELIFRTYRDGSVSIATWNAFLAIAVAAFIMSSYMSYVNILRYFSTPLAGLRRDS